MTIKEQIDFLKEKNQIKKILISKKNKNEKSISLNKIIKNKDLAIFLVKEKPEYYNELEEKFIYDYDVFKEAMKSSKGSKKVFDVYYEKYKRTKYAKDLCLFSVNENGFLIRYISEKLSKEKDIVLSAIKKSPYVMMYINRSFFCDKDVVSCFYENIQDKSINKDYCILRVLQYSDGKLKKELTDSINKHILSFLNHK